MIPSVAERAAFQAEQVEKALAVDALERAVFRWRSERKIAGADARLRDAIAACADVLRERDGG